MEIRISFLLINCVFRAIKCIVTFQSFFCDFSIVSRHFSNFFLHEILMRVNFSILSLHLNCMRINRLIKMSNCCILEHLKSIIVIIVLVLKLFALIAVLVSLDSLVTDRGGRKRFFCVF